LCQDRLMSTSRNLPFFLFTSCSILLLYITCIAAFLSLPVLRTSPGGKLSTINCKTRIRVQPGDVQYLARISSLRIASPTANYFPIRELLKSSKEATTQEKQGNRNTPGLRPHIARFIQCALLPSFASLLGVAVKPAHAYRDTSMSPETRIVAASTSFWTTDMG